MALRFNTFRSQRYLRSKFVEGRFLLASEASDIELELIDLLRKTVQSTVGDVAIDDAWKVTRLTSTELLISPGDAWFKGLPYSMRSGKDHLVSGASLTLGIVPAGVSITDDSTGLGKILTFNDGASTPSDAYKMIISAREELVTDTDDLFLKNANLTESTAQKVRLTYRLDIVSQSVVTETPIPYTNDITDQNLTNQITFTPQAALNGEIISLTAIPGAEEIDGRDIEVILRNNPALGGGNPIPNGTTDQQTFYNGVLIDSNGSKYHINSIFNDVIGTQVTIRIDKEFGQPNPEIINGLPVTLVKRDVYVTDDVNGNFLGKLFYPISDVIFDSTDGFIHQSVITDLRDSSVSDMDYQNITDQKFGLMLTEGGTVSFLDTVLTAASGTIEITDNTFTAGDGVEVDGTNFINGVDFTVGIDTDATSLDLATQIALLPNVGAVAVGSIITITASLAGSAGNAITMSKIDSDSSNFDLSGATLKNGADDVASLLTWTSAFSIVNPHGPQMTIAAGNAAILDGGSIVYSLDFAGGTIQFGNLATNITATGSTLTLDPIDLSTVILGNTISIEAESAEIIAIDDVNDTIEVSPALTLTGAASIHRDSFSAESATLNEKTFTLATRKGDRVYINSKLELENGESGEIGDINSNVLTYTGMPDENATDPIYSSTSILTQGIDLTAGMGQLDTATGAALAALLIVGNGVYTSNIRGLLDETLTARAGVLTDAIGDSQEDRSTFLRSDEVVVWNGSQLNFTADIIVQVVNTKSGAETEHTIALANSPIVLANREIAYVTIDRTIDEAALTLNIVAEDAIPAQIQATKDIIVLFKRIDTPADGEILHIPLHKQAIEVGQSLRLGASGAGGVNAKTQLSASVSGDGTGAVGCSAAQVVSGAGLATRVSLDSAFTYNPDFNTGTSKGDLTVNVNGQEIERLIVGVNDTDESIVYEESLTGDYVDIYEIELGTSDPIPLEDNIPVQIYKVQYKVAELDAVAANVAPAVDNLYDLGTAGNRWRKLGVALVATDLIPESDNLQDLGSISQRWRDLYLGPGSLKINDGVDTAEIKMVGGKAGFLQPGGTFKEFGSVDDEAILGADDTQTYIKKILIDAPNTEIQNRAQIEDESNSLKCLSPVTEIIFNSSKIVPNEYGPNGEVVREIDNGDFKIRLVGDWANETDTNNSRVTTTDTAAYIEVVGQMTGLILLHTQDASVIDLRKTIDGGLESATNIYGAVKSSVLDIRGYKTKNHVVVETGLASGVHRIKVRLQATFMSLYGIRILNEDTQLTVKQGKAFSGLTPIELTSDTNLPYKPTALVTSKGAKVLNYIDPLDGIAKQVFTEVDATSLFLASTDHSNEEEIRAGGIHFKEFGTNRVDDFSTLTGVSSNRVFTLDDGSTTLSGSSVAVATNSGVEGIDLTTSTAFITITFTGTGLDCFVGTTTVAGTNDVFVDEVSKGPLTFLANSAYRQPICSGLEQGTHTVKIANNSAAVINLSISNLIIYQSKKPTTIDGTIELLEYNVLADFVANTTAGLNTISTGVIRKSPLREISYVEGAGGTTSWGILGIDLVNNVGGFQLFTDRPGAYFETEFFGEGFDHRFRADINRATNIAVTLNGTPLTAANFPTAVFTTYGAGVTFNSATGELDQFANPAVNGSGFTVSNLPVDEYILRMTTPGSILAIDALDIIVPIHINKSNFKGFDSTIDSRNFSFIKEFKGKVDLTKAKAWVTYNQQTNEILESFNISAVLDLAVARSQFHFEKSFKNENYVITFGSQERLDVLSRTSSYIEIRSINPVTASTEVDTSYLTFAVFGELADEGEE